MIKLTPVSMCFLLFTFIHILLTEGCGWHATYAESNYYRNLQQIEHLMTAQAKNVVLVGSSIGSRVHPNEFLSDLGFINLGLGGTVPVTALKILQREKITPQLLLVELSGATLAEPKKNDDLILRQQNKFNPLLWRYIPVTRPTSRPSSMLYSLLKIAKEPVHPMSWFEKYKLNANDHIISNAQDGSYSFSDEVKNSELVALVKSFKNQGSRILFVHLPTGRNRDIYSYDIAQQAAIYLASDIIDLDAISKNKNVIINYTDGLHLDRTSAILCSMWLAQAISNFLKQADPHLVRAF